MLQHSRITAQDSEFQGDMPTRKQREATKRIETILRQRTSSLVDELAKVEDILSLPREVRKRIVDELVSEFSEKGLLSDSEPNKYGLEIDDLIGVCGLALDDKADK